MNENLGKVVHINLDAIRSQYFEKLQHQFDIVSLIIGGTTYVTPEQVAEERGALCFLPSSNHELNHEDARSKAFSWLYIGFLRDAIEATGLFLDECLMIASIAEMKGRKKILHSDLDELFTKRPKKNHKLHFPQKIESLHKHFNFDIELADYVVSLNKLRTCIVHRLGKVGESDIDSNGFLTVKWLTSKIIARSYTTGQEFEVQLPQKKPFKEEMALGLWTVTHERQFALGENIELNPIEIYSTILTLYQFGQACITSLETYMSSLGIKLRPATPS